MWRCNIRIISIIFLFILISLIACAPVPKVKTIPIDTEQLEGKIAFISETTPGFLGSILSWRSGARTEIYIIDAKGNNGIMITNLNSTLFAPVWSPTGSKIAFLAVPKRMPFSPFKKILYIIDPDGEHIKKLGVYECSFPRDENPLKEIFPPQWSPEGNRVLIPSRRGLHTVNLKGEERTLVNRKNLKEAIWSPDGAQIAFTDGKDLYLIDSTGSTELNITKNRGIGFLHENDVRALAWSHDGSKIGFSYKDRLVILDLTTLTMKPIYKSSYSVWAVRWFPNDEKLLFVSGVPDKTTALRSVAQPTGTLYGYFEIYTIRPDGEEAVMIHKEDICDVRLVRPSFSPDGSTIVITSPTSHGHLWLLSCDGSKGSQIAKRAKSYHPNWTSYKLD